MKRYATHYAALLRYLVTLPMWLAVDQWLRHSTIGRTVALDFWLWLLPGMGFAFHPGKWWEPESDDSENDHGEVP